MTKQQKDLLLKDLCARLPYDVFVKDTYNGHNGRMYKITKGCVYYVSEVNCNHLQSHPRCIKPYLRSLSSMTEEEILEFIQIGDSVLRIGERKSTCILSLKQMDWLNSHHFDYRGLIEKGLALEAKEEMYNF